MLKEIKVVCTSGFGIYNGEMLEGEFFEGNEYTATLDEELEEYYIKSDEGYEHRVAHYEDDDFIIDEDFELVDIFN